MRLLRSTVNLSSKNRYHFRFFCMLDVGKSYLVSLRYVLSFLDEVIYIDTLIRLYIKKMPHVGQAWKLNVLSWDDKDTKNYNHH